MQAGDTSQVLTWKCRAGHPNSICRLWSQFRPNQPSGVQGSCSQSQLQPQRPFLTASSPHRLAKPKSMMSSKLDFSTALWYNKNTDWEGRWQKYLLSTTFVLKPFPTLGTVPTCSYIYRQEPWGSEKLGNSLKVPELESYTARAGRKFWLMPKSPLYCNSCMLLNNKCVCIVC